MNGIDRIAREYVKAVLGLVDVSQGDLEQFAAQSDEAVQHYAERDRVAVVGFLGSLASIARRQAVDRLQGEEAGAVAVLAQHDRTAPLTHRRDDLGTVIAWALRFRDDPTTRPGVRDLWVGILRELSQTRELIDEQLASHGAS